MKELLFFKNKRVFVTGHTGFKGSWLCKMLVNLGADVTGYSLPPSDDMLLFNLTGVESKINSVFGDIRDVGSLDAAFKKSNPEIVFHLAAQPIVRSGYEDPRYTYETNLMGTVNILECVRQSDCVKSFLNVTTDKVYLNREWEWGYRENEPLDGFDPYSNSKSCSELATHCYNNSFFKARNIAVSTARAGNVIGGGDFAQNRIVPDCVRAVINKDKIVLRNPSSIRPYQHVLEPLYAYLLIVKRQYQDITLAGYYNIGPEEHDCITTGRLTDLFCREWGNGLCWENVSEQNAPHEANLLKLDCSRLKAVFDWKPSWNIERAIAKTVEWTKVYISGGDIPACMDRQIEDFLNA